MASTRGERYEMRLTEDELRAIGAIKARLGLFSKAAVLREGLSLLYDQTLSSSEDPVVAAAPHTVCRHGLSSCKICGFGVGSSSYDERRRSG